MMSSSSALSRLRAALNRRLDRVGTQPSPGTFAAIPRATSSESSTRSSRSISSIASLPTSLDSSVRVSTVSVIERISRSKRERLPVPPRADPWHRDLAHRAQVAGDLGAVERRLHQPPLPLVVLALRHHQPVADQPLGPPEAKPLL